jgi:RepB DNA-primase from phage plasmid
MVHSTLPAERSKILNEAAVRAFVAVLLRSTAGRFFVCSLPNVRGDDLPDQIWTRDSDEVVEFAKKWDQPGRGTFYCVSTTKGRKRNKNNYAQSVLVHTDVDFTSIKETPAQAEASLRSLTLPPSRLHFSGNGIHALWVIKKPITDSARVTDLVQKLARIVGGDTMVCHVVALMRLPGTHNTKEGAWTEVTAEDTGATYSLNDVAKLVSTTEPVLTIKGKSTEDNVFLRLARQLRSAPMDVAERLADMTYGGAAGDGVHDTQLSVTAALMQRGRSIDEITAYVLQETRKVSGTESWNWDVEETAIREMCEDWEEKHPVETVTDPRASHEAQT